MTATKNEGGISGTMFEAFAAHTPMIYTALDVFAERLTPNEYGYVFPVGDPVALADCLVAACSNKDEAQKRAQNAFKFANERTWADTAEDYLDAFEDAISRWPKSENEAETKKPATPTKSGKVTK